jgi:hypothetical protein
VALRFIIFSEDQQRDAPQVVIAFVKRLLQHVSANVQTHLPEYVPDNNHKAVMSGNNWREKKGQSRRPETIRLIRAIADYLAEPDTFVVFHTDGDTKWSDRAESNIRGQFQQRIVEKVHAVLQGSKKLTEQERLRSAARLLHLVPHYSIEAWIFQNIERCRHHGKPSDVEQLDLWAKDPRLLDEVSKPKESLSFGDKHNHDIATVSFPTARLVTADASFVACGEQFKANDQLVARLRP